jgi:hypothetical protein
MGSVHGETGMHLISKPDAQGFLFGFASCPFSKDENEIFG